MMVAMVSGDDCAPRTFSISFITFAGLKKWVPITLLGRLVAQRPGHALHHALLNALLQDATAWTVESSGERVEFSVSGK